MGISITNIAKGLAHRLGKRKTKGRFPALTWTREKILKHQDDTSLKQIAFGDLQIAYKRPYELLHTYKELFGDEIYRFQSAIPNPVVVDCGANIGLSVLYFKKLYPAAKVIAYEPDADNLQLLKQNIALNNLIDVDCRQSAVWISNDDLLFDASGTQGSGIVTNHTAATVVRMKAERLADVLKNTAVDFLKIDIEGAEGEVVKDCAPYLQNVRNMFVEYHGKAGETAKLAELLAVLQNHFQVYIKLAADNLKHPFVEKSTGASFDVQLNIFCYPFVKH